MTFKNKIRKIVIKLGIKRFFISVLDFMNKGKARKLMKLYDPESFTYGLNTDKRNLEITVSFTTYPPPYTFCSVCRRFHAKADNKAR